MVAGETILKFTDYPFAYSFLGLISGIIGFSINENHLIFLGIAGGLGTLLTILDPIGWLIRNGAETRIKLNKKSYLKPDEIIDTHYRLSAIKSKAINFEIEKIIGVFYFIILIGFFIISVAAPVPFIEKIIILDPNGNPICSQDCFKIGYSASGIIVFGILSIKALYFRKHLDEKINIAGYHQIAINNDNATQTSVESMTRAVEQNDWEIAKLWMNKIKEEIKYKKGKRELIIKAADMVFSKLHGETVDFDEKLKQMENTRFYPNFDNKQWLAIKQYSQQSIIEDTELRRRIDAFYTLMKDYHSIIGSVNREIRLIINNRISEIYDQKVDEVTFETTNGTVDLLPCVISNTHPLVSYNEKTTLRTIRLRVKKQDNMEYEEYFDINRFDTAWDLIIKDVEKNELITKIKNDLKLLSIENTKLQKIYSEKIEMQWKV